MSDTHNTPSDTKLIVGYFFDGKVSGGASSQIKALTPEDRAQLGNAIRTGSMTY